MNSKPAPELIDDENPEWTQDDVQRAWPAYEVLPSGLLKKLGVCDPQKTPTKVPTTIRLSPEVMQAFKAAGAGWQTRLDAALKDWLCTHSPG